MGGMGLKTCGCCARGVDCLQSTPRYCTRDSGPVYFGDELTSPASNSPVAGRIWDAGDNDKIGVCRTGQIVGTTVPRATKSVRIGVDTPSLYITSPLVFRIPPATMRHFITESTPALTAATTARTFAYRGSGEIPGGFNQSAGVPETQLRAFRFNADGVPLHGIVHTSQPVEYHVPFLPTNPEAFLQGSFGKGIVSHSFDIEANRDSEITCDLWFRFGGITAAMVAAQSPYQTYPIEQFLQMQVVEWRASDNATSPEFVHASELNVTGLRYCPAVGESSTWTVTPTDVYSAVELPAGICVSEDVITTEQPAFNGYEAYEQLWRFYWGELWPSLAVRVKIREQANPFNTITGWIHYKPQNDTWNGGGTVVMVPWTFDTGNENDQPYFARRLTSGGNATFGTLYPSTVAVTLNS